jgi:hypothetical protein
VGSQQVENENEENSEPVTPETPGVLDDGSAANTTELATEPSATASENLTKPADSAAPSTSPVELKPQLRSHDEQAKKMYKFKKFMEKNKELFKEFVKNKRQEKSTTIKTQTEPMNVAFTK